MDFESIGVRWKVDRVSVRTPPAGDVGPNQILLHEEHFRDGYIEAVVQPVALQPYLEPTKKNRMECGLLGRFQDLDNYIAAGLGVHGEDLGITRVEGGRFYWQDRASFEETRDPKGREFRLRLTFKEDEVTLSCDGVVRCHAKTGIRAGRCGLRTDWTEAHFKNIKVKNNDAHCLVIGPIGAVSSATRERSDRLLKTLICPTLAAHGYNARRADQFMNSHGDINAEIFRHLIDDTLVIADLSEHNPNVYYELAIRHAVRKPFIHIIQVDDKLPFDVQSMRTIEVDLGSAESIQRAVGDLNRVLSSLSSYLDVTTPVPKQWTLVQTEGMPRPRGEPS
jgi:hypothetical protein